MQPSPQSSVVRNAAQSTERAGGSCRGDLPQLFVALGIFAGAVVSGFTGFAFSAVAGAVLLHVMPPREAVPLMMVCSVPVQSLSLVSLRRHIDWRGSLRLILGGLVYVF